MERVENGYRGNVDRETLYEELDGLLLRIAFAEIEEEELAALDNTQGWEMDSGYSEEATRRALVAIAEGFRKKKRRVSLRRILPRVGQIAAAVVLVLFVGLTTAVATVQWVRIKVLDFIMNIDEQYTELGFEESEGAYVEIPAEWDGHYYPAYIPSEFKLSYMDVDLREAYYADASGHQLRFGEYDASTSTNIDTEDGAISFVSIHGRNALVSEKEGTTLVAWDADSRYFVLWLEGARDVAIEIALSVKMIK